MQKLMRRHYSIKNVLDQLADALLNQDDVGLLLQDSLQIYNSAIQPTFSTAYAVTKDGVLAQEGIGSSSLLMDERLLRQIDPEIRVRPVKDLENISLRQTLQIHDVELIDTTAREGKLNGIYLFGKSTSGGSYSVQDLELLTISGKNLAVSIENAIRFRMIENFNEQLKAEVAVATRKLRLTNKKLVSLDKTKDEFMSIASHQLRTPLTTIKNLTLLLRDERFGSVNTQQKQALQTAYVSVDRMVSLIQEFLDASSISSGSFEVRREPTRIKAVLEEAVANVTDTVKENRQKLTVDFDADDPIVSIDQQKIKEVLLNYLDNAIQYTSRGRAIIIKLEVIDGFVQVSITDQGIGVPEDEQPGLFSKSFRATNARSHRPDGTGLGLFLAKKIIEAHNGEIIFSSKINVGSTFGFKLPLE